MNKEINLSKVEEAEFWADVKEQAEVGVIPRALIDEDGLVLLYEGTYGGTLIFYADGIVTVEWNINAALAAAHGSGNRKRRVTVSTGKRTPPELAPDFKRAKHYRDSALMFASWGQPYPDDFKDPKIADILANELRYPAWKMMSAVLNGDAATLRRIADAVELAEKIRVEGQQFTPTRSWEELAEAVRRAAEQAGVPPTRPQILKELIKINPNRTSEESLVSELGRMGFGWLAQKACRPRKPKKGKSIKAKKVGRKPGE